MNKVFLDVNIPMYAAGKFSEYKKPCVDVLTMIEEEKIKAAIDVEIIQEILYRYHSIGLQEEALELSWGLLEIGVDVLELRKEDMELAMYYYQKYSKSGISPRDTLHTAVMVNNGLKEIISIDSHFDQIQEVKRIDPTDVIKRVRL